MRDEHYYTRALKLNPERSADYHLGRADFYCIEHEYKKAYQDYQKAQKLGADLNKSYRYQTCVDFINSDKNISELTDRISKDTENYELYCNRAKYYLLKREYSKCISDVERAIQINPCSYTYEFSDDIFYKIRELNVFDNVNNSKKKDIINACKLRIKFAQENINLYKNAEYWHYRALKDLDKIVELAKDKTLALYLKVNFYEGLKDIRRFKTDKIYINKAISTCKNVIEQSKNRTDKLGKTLTYLYEMKLVSLYSNEEDFEQAIKIAILHPDKPTSEDLKKGLKYINNFAFIHVDVLRSKLSDSHDKKEK